MLDSTADLSALDLFNPSEEHKLLRDMVRDFVREEVEPQAERYNREEKFNVELFRKCGELGLLAATVPEAHGGSGMDAVASVIIHEELCTSDPGFGLAYLAHSILFVNNFYHNASDELRARILPRVASGEWLGCMGMTEAGAGTDVLAMQTRAEKKGDGYVLNGQKIWITNGGYDEHTLCDVGLVYARTGDGISSFVVEKGMPGFTLGQKFKDKLGMRSSMTFELVFENCEVPAANLLGKEGESLLHMMRNLEIERVTLAAMSLGIARRCLEVMIEYAEQRKTFGVPINRHGQIQRRIARAYAQYKAARIYVYDTARRMKLTETNQRVDADGVKLLASEMAKEVADHAIQVLGGNGYIAEYVVERLWRDAKLNEIGGGTVEAHEKNMTKDLTRDRSFLYR
jgi:isovaleryl-CoA dehydrogenase